jgi:polar amino acid transport system substrate-binding protein
MRRFNPAVAANVAIFIINVDRLSMLKQLLIFCAMTCPLAQAATVVAYADESAPYHYTEQGQVVGIATEMLQAACKEAAIDCQIIILPWARANALVRAKPNSLIFSIVRRPEWEKDLIWVRPIITEGMWLFGRSDGTTLSSLAELDKEHIGAINGGSAIAILRQHGVLKSSIDPANSIEANFKKFAAGRVDYIVDTELRFGVEQARFPLPFKTRKALKLQDVTSYFAMNLKSDQAIVSALRQALDKLRANKSLEQIKRKYAAGE